MTRTISLFAVAAIGVAMAAPAWAATDAECQDMWKKADANATASCPTANRCATSR